MIRFIQTTIDGLGIGSTGFRELGLTAPLPVAALREAVAVIRRLLRGEEVTFQGKVVSLSQGRLQFAPLRHDVPIYFLRFPDFARGRQDLYEALRPLLEAHGVTAGEAGDALRTVVRPDLIHEFPAGS